MPKDTQACIPLFYKALSKVLITIAF